MVCSSLEVYLLSSLLMLTGLVAQILVVLLLNGVFFYEMLLFLEKCKKQDCIFTSSTEAEYCTMLAACFEIVWLRDF